MSDEDALMLELGAEAASRPDDTPADRLGQIQMLAGRVNVIDSRIEKGEALLKQLKEERLSILGRDLVDLMDAAAIDDVTVDGRKFTAGPYFKASIAADSPTAEDAYEWLTENDAGDLINCTVVASFPKECLEEAMALKDYIVQRHQMATVEVKRAVPWARLTSWVKEQYEIAREELRPLQLPLELLGATVGRVVKIKEPKAR